MILSHTRTANKDDHGFGRVFGWILILAAFSILIYQAYLWQRYGVWTAIEMRDFVGPLKPTNWVGLNEIVHWFGRRSAALVFFAVGCLTILGTENIESLKRVQGRQHRLLS